MKMLKVVGGILAASGLCALEATAQSSFSTSVKGQLARPPFALTPQGGNLGGDILSTSSVRFVVPLAGPKFAASPHSTLSPQVIAALAARLARRELGADEVLAIRVSSAGSFALVEIDVRKHVQSHSASIGSVKTLGKPKGGMTPGGSLAMRVKKPLADGR